MTMLDAGGFPVSGPRPSYEDARRWPRGIPDREWLREQRGRAVKWIIHGPALCAPVFDALSVPPVVIWLERDYRQQARSQLKLVGIEQERGAERALARSILRDTPPIRATMRRRARAIYTMGFASLVENPSLAADFLGSIIAGHFDRSFDAETAARVVISRDPACLPHLAMEQHIAPMIAAELGRSR